MHPFLRPHIRVRQQGQTLIIALIVLGILLILGLVFLGLVDRNLRNAARGQSRSQATDLAEAGVRYAHGQLVSSLLGADWRGVPTQLAEATPNVTGDPDAYYLRPGYNRNDPANSSGVPNDLGGPDRLGPFIRVQFPQGRALVRVRYGASDASTAKLVPGGPLRNPGAARSTLIIEAVGRPGAFNSKDPTTFNTAGGLQFKGFADEATLTVGIAALAQADGQLATSRRMVAFAPIGIIDAARFETNVFNSSAPIPLGISSGLGIAAYNDAGLSTNTDVGLTLESQLGTPGTVASTSNSYLLPRGEGSLIANGDVALYGNVHVYMNRTLGDTFRVSGRILDGDSGNAATLTITPSLFSGTQYQTSADIRLTAAGTGDGSFDSQNAAFNTAAGLVIDGSTRTDKFGYPSGAGALVPPSAQAVDPQTKLNRYVAMTRESGEALSTQNLENNGAFGHGAGVYVDNAGDRQEATDAQGRRTQGSQRSLFDDWLNPDSGAAGSGWDGPFYVPTAAVVQLLPDGFIIQRDATVAAERFWKNATGGTTTLSTLRYRLGRGTDGQVHVLDTTTSPKDINENTLNLDDFQQGPPFNGVLYFEGNVRVRGTIPTGVQMTLVSGATIYIDGSITKGITANEVTGGTRGDAIDGLPTATLMLMAKDNVALNTPNFFGPTAGQRLEAANDVASATTISPVRLGAAGGTGSGQLELQADLALDPNDPSTGSPLTDPRQWTPYAMTYTSWENNATLPGNRVPTEFLLAHTMDDGTASASFLRLDANFGSGVADASVYPFTAGIDAAHLDNVIANTAATYLSAGTGVTPTSVSIYGLGAESWQRYAKFETRSFPLVPVPGNATYSATGGNAGKITQSGTNYTLFSSGNDLLLRPGAIAGVSTNDLLVGRSAVTPSEVKIEASIFAEQGSFFVIPGPWFNPQPNDTHKAYMDNVNGLQKPPFSLTADQANLRASRERLEAYGSGPGAPFYGEPLDVRLSVIGSVAENLPPPISVQSEWVRKWGWIPRRLAATGIGIPSAHVPGTTATDKTTYMNGNGTTAPAHNFVPNLTIQYDPVLATGRLNDPLRSTLVRADGYGRPLPPMPRLPVSPKLAYFGEL